MKHHRKKYNKKIIFFGFLIGISFIIHLIMVNAIFQYNFHRQVIAIWDTLTQKLTPEQNKKFLDLLKQKRQKTLASLQSIPKTKKPDLSNLPAKLRAPKSKFGWVLFDEPPKKETQTLAIPTTLDGPIGEATSALATERQETKPVSASPATPGLRQLDEETVRRSSPSVDGQAEQKQHASPAEHKEHDKSPTAERKTVTKSISEKKSHTLHTTTNPKALATALVADKEASIQDRIAQIKAFQERIEAFQAGDISAAKTPSAQTASAIVEQEQPKERLIGGEGGIRVRGARSKKQSIKRSIIALTKGFVEKTEGEDGTDLIDRDGDPNKRPSFEELKYMSYEAKINWCLQASWKQNFCHRPMARPLEGEAVIDFILDEHGNLKECKILQSTGYPELDSMIMKNMKCASPFPPLPKHFGTQTYHTGRLISVRYSKFGF